MLNRNDDNREEKNMVIYMVAAASVLLLLFLIVLYMHDNKNSTQFATKEQPALEEQTPDIEVGRTNFVSSDLDFWEMYDEEPETDTEDEDNDETTSSSSKSSSSSSSSKKEDNATSSSSEKKDKDDMDDGKHIKVVGSDGKPAYYEILDDVEKNKYDFEKNLGYENGFLKYNGSDLKSLTGIDISGYDGKVDFVKVKDAGVSFVMIKVASRGYDTGLVTIDDRFVEYAQGATDAGLPIGMYFVSHAITDVEAVEEANYAIAAGMNYNVRYPVAIDLDSSYGTTGRTSRMTKSETTAIVLKFCETVKSYGKIPVICASRDFLITSLDLTQLKGYDIWLKDEAVTADSKSDSSSEQKDSSDEKKDSSSKRQDSSSEDEKKSDEYIGTDYPYEFSMWQYSQKGTVNGIEGSVKLDMSFVNYAER